MFASSKDGTKRPHHGGWNSNSSSADDETMASPSRYTWNRSPGAGTKTLEQLMTTYKSLLKTEVERDKETLYLQTLQNLNELVQMLDLEKKKLSTELDDVKEKYAELQKESHSFRGSVASSRLQSNYTAGAHSQLTGQSQKELNRVLSAKSNIPHLPPVTRGSTPPTLEAVAAEEELKMVKEEQKKLHDALDKIKSENEQLKKENTSVQALKAKQSQQLDGELKAVKEEKQKLQETNSKLKFENEQLKKQLTDAQLSKAQLNQNLNDFEKTMKEALQGLDAAQKETESVKKEKEKLEDEIRQLRSSGYGQTSRWGQNSMSYGGFGRFGSPRPPPQKTVSVQLVSRHVSSHGDALRDLAGQVTNSLLQQNVRADFVHSEAASSARPLVVACLRALRLGTDVNEALSGINRDSSVGLVVLHHQGPHVRQCDVTEKQLSSETSELGVVVDVVFWKDRGLYESDINSASLTRLCSYLAQFAQ